MRKNRRELFEKRDDGPSDFREAFIRKQLLLRVSVSLERGKGRGGGGGGRWYRDWKLLQLP